MKYFFLIVFLLIPTLCFADTNSILEADDPPAYDECDGSFVEEITGEGMAVLVIFGEGELAKGGLLTGEAMTVDILFEDGVLLKVTNATALVDGPPAYDECDGAFIQSLEGQGMTIEVIFGEGVLNDFKIHGEPMVITITMPDVPPQKIVFRQGIEFEQGIDFYGHNVKWKACPNAALMGP
jgi:hypothetical protein